jgi:mRNA-degrading endonuclease RelE of RelBE toxin-antitoxin system
MPDKIKKFLRKLSKKQLAFLLPFVSRVEANDLMGLDIKQLKGQKDMYRLRVGRYRIIFCRISDKENEIVLVGLRDDQTYRDYK